MACSNPNSADTLFGRAASLMSLLPTGTYFALTFLVPLVTNHGHCKKENEIAKYCTLVMLAALSLFCLFSCFIDTIQGPNGHVYIGVATWSEPGLCFPCENSEIADSLLPKRRSLGKKITYLARYGLKPQDFVHAVLSVAVLGMSAMTITDLRMCLLPDMRPSEIQYWTVNMTQAVGFVASIVFLAIPTTRRGLGFQKTAPA